MNISREDLAWAAGLFEGEGCILNRFHNDRVLAVGARISTYTDLDVLQRFKDIIGFGKITGPYQRYGPDGSPYKTSWSWKADSFEEAQATIALLWPWLGKRRREKAKECLALFHKRDLRSGKGISRRPILKEHVSTIRSLVKSGLTQSEVAKRFNASPSAICMICSRKNYKGLD